MLFQLQSDFPYGKVKTNIIICWKGEKKRRRKEYMSIFINRKQKRVKRPTTIDGMDLEKFVRRNADPIWLHKNQMWEYMTDDEESWPRNYCMNLWYARKQTRLQWKIIFVYH